MNSAKTNSGDKSLTINVSYSLGNSIYPSLTVIEKLIEINYN